MKDKELKEALALQLYHYLAEDTDTKLRWTGTKTNLIEVVSYLFYLGRMCDEYDVPLSMKRLVRLSCLRFGLPVPKSVSRFLENIANVRNVKSHTVVEMMKARCRKTGKQPLLECFLEADTYKDTHKDT